MIGSFKTLIIYIVFFTAVLFYPSAAVLKVCFVRFVRKLTADYTAAVIANQIVYSAFIIIKIRRQAESAAGRKHSSRQFINRTCNFLRNIAFRHLTAYRTHRGKNNRCYYNHYKSIPHCNSQLNGNTSHSLSPAPPIT